MSFRAMVDYIRNSGCLHLGKWLKNGQQFKMSTFWWFHVWCLSYHQAEKNQMDT